MFNILPFKVSFELVINLNIFKLVNIIVFNDSSIRPINLFKT